RFNRTLSFASPNLTGSKGSNGRSSQPNWGTPSVFVFRFTFMVPLSCTELKLIRVIPSEGRRGFCQEAGVLPLGLVAGYRLTVHPVLSDVHRNLGERHSTEP